MYNEFFGLQRNPFDNSPDPDFLFPSASHREGLAALIYGISDGKGLVALSGAVGTGKTLLLQAAKAKIAPPHLLLEINTPWATPKEIFAAISRTLEIPMTFADDSIAYIEALKSRLIGMEQSGRRFVVVFDEAQLLPERTLETVRLLSNIEIPGIKLIQIVLVGQPDLLKILGRDRLVSLRQRIFVFRTLGSLSQAETAAYVRFRLRKAGASNDIFTREALGLLFTATNGNPRLLNQLCDNCLLSAYAMGQSQVDARIAADSIQDLPNVQADRESAADTDEAHDGQARTAAMDDGAEPVDDPDHPAPEQSPPRAVGNGHRWGYALAGAVVAGVLILLAREVSWPPFGASPAPSPVDSQRAPGLTQYAPEPSDPHPPPQRSSARSDTVVPERSTQSRVETAADLGDDMPMATTPLQEEPWPTSRDPRIVSQPLAGPPSPGPGTLPALPRPVGPPATISPRSTRAADLVAEYQDLVVSSHLSEADTASPELEQPRADDVLVAAAPDPDPERPPAVGDSPQLAFPFAPSQAGPAEDVAIARDATIISLARGRYRAWNTTIMDILASANPQYTDLNSIHAGTRFRFPELRRDRLFVRAPNGSYYAYFMTLSQSSAARSVLGRLGAEGYAGEILTAQREGRPLYRIYLGPYASAAVMEEDLGRVSFRHLPTLDLP